MFKILFAIQQELRCKKAQYNAFGKYNYRSCEDILEAVKPLLAKNSAVLTLSDDIVEKGGRIYVQATATLIGEEGVIHTVTAYAREDETKKGMDGAQITGSASSYARKYALSGLFAIDDEKDADATNDHGKSDASAKETKVAMASPMQVKVIGGYPQATQEWICGKFGVNTFDELTKTQATEIIKTVNAKRKAQEAAADDMEDVEKAFEGVS